MSRHHTLFGLHAAQSTLAHTPEKILQAWVDTQRQDDKLTGLCRQLEQLGVKPQKMERKRLEKMAKGQTHQGIMLEVRLPQSYNEQALEHAFSQLDATPFYLVLDQVQDPHNLGACLRTADAAGVQGVIVPQNQSADLTPTVCKVASGAAETVPLYRVTNLARTLRWLKQQGVWIIGTADQADMTLYAADLRPGLAVVMGSEGKGLRRLTREQCDWTVQLPMSGYVPSLNVSVATGVVLYEALRQRRASTDG